MAIRYANRIEEKLQGDKAEVWLEKMFKSRIDHFNTEASQTDIDRYIISAFTRMRFCHKDHRLDFDQKSAPSKALREKGLKPWFKCDNRKSIELKTIFGHWSTLGFYKDENVLALDTGCLWGGSLTAARIDLDKIKIVSVECAGSSIKL